MTEAVRGYLLSVACVSLLLAAAMTLVPRGSVRQVLGVTGALLLALTVVRPLLRLDETALAQAIARLEMQAETARTGVEMQNRALVTGIIKQNAEAYILDKASSMGLSLTVEVEMADTDAYPYPEAVHLTGEAAPEQKRLLGAYIAEKLAIPAERQTWNTETERPAG